MQPQRLSVDPVEQVSRRASAGYENRDQPCLRLLIVILLSEGLTGCYLCSSGQWFSDCGTESASSGGLATIQTAKPHLQTLVL